MSHIPRKMPKVAEAFARTFARSEVVNSASPFVAFSGVGFVILLGLYTALSVNPRIQSIGKPVELSGPEAGDARLWIGVAARNEMVVIKGNDGRVFTWPLKGPSAQELSQFEKYLHERVHDIIVDGTLADRLEKSTIQAVISVDEKLNFHHVRPVLYALASARITHYAFEGRIVK